MGRQVRGSQKVTKIKLNRYFRPRYLLMIILLTILAFLFFFPILVTVADSFMAPSEIKSRYEYDWAQEQKNLQYIQKQYTDLYGADAVNEAGISDGSGFFGRSKGISLIPYPFSLDQYYQVLVENYTYLNMFWNSVKLTVFITIGNILIAIMTSYVLTCIKFKGRNLIQFIYIIPFSTLARKNNGATPHEYWGCSVLEVSIKCCNAVLL